MQTNDTTTLSSQASSPPTSIFQQLEQQLNDSRRKQNAADIARANGGKGVEHNGEYPFKCPVHEDEHASASAKDDGDKVLVHCQVCGKQGQAALVEALKRQGFSFGQSHARADLNSGKRQIEKIYAYYDDAGTLIFEKVRYCPKGFSIRRPDGNGGHIYTDVTKGIDTSIVYRLPGVLRAVKDGQTVYIAEGEKDCDNLASCGLVATCNAFGASKDKAEPKWASAHAKWLKGAREVVILPDNDDAGRAHALAVAKSMAVINVPCKIVELPGLAPKGDVSDWLQAGGNREELLRLCEAAPFWKQECRPDESLAPATPEEWTDPKEIKAELLPVRRLPEELIPPILLPWVKDVSFRMQTPLEFAATAAIVMTGGLIGTACGMRPKQKDNWTVIPNLWGGIIASPGKLKSPSLDEAMKPLSVLEAGAQSEYDQRQKTYKADYAEYEAREASLKDLIKATARAEESGKKKPDDMKSIATLKEQMEKLSSPQAPALKRYKANDATVPKLHELLSTNPRGILVLRDELVGLLSSLDKEDRQEDKAFYLQGWNGYGDFTYDRIGRGSIYVPRVCLSVFGGIQPDKMRNYLYAAMRRDQDDGMVQRFQMMTYPDDVAWEYVDEHPNAEAKEKSLKAISAIATADFLKMGATQEQDGVPFFRFDSDAQEYFKQWITNLETNKLRAQEEPVILEHLSKYRSLMPSLALIIHVLNVTGGITGEGQIGLETAEMAAAWCDFLEAHARRIYGLVVNVRLKAALSLAAKIKKKELRAYFNARDVYRHGWTYLTSVEDAEAALSELVLHHWLREQEDGKTIRYVINPKIFKAS